MKIVYCGGLEWCKFAPDHLGIKQGFDDLGWDWYIVDPILYDPSGDEIAAQINEINPDLVIHGNTDSLTKMVCPRVNKSIPQVFWMLDYRTPDMLDQNMWYGWTQNGPSLKAIFISAKDHMTLWEKEFGVRTLFAPHACYVPRPDEMEQREEYAHDVLFIGVRHTHPPFSARTELLEQIQRHCPVPITYVNETDWTRRDEVWKAMGHYYRSSKVVLDISHFWDNAGYCSGRYWYTATYGAAAVTRWFPDCETFFPNGHKWYFKNPADAGHLISFLLDDEQARQRTRERVMEWAWTHHSYKQRFTEMVEALETL